MSVELRAKCGGGSGSLPGAATASKLQVLDDFLDGSLGVAK